MNPLAVAVFGYLLLGLEEALRPALSLGETRIAPYLVVVLVCFVALHAPTLAALWTGLALGLCSDLLAARSAEGGAAVTIIIGPNAVGFLAAAGFVVVIRGLMMRRNPWVMVFLAVVGSAVAKVAAAFLLAVRSVLDPAISISPAVELTTGLGSSLYTAVTAAALVWPLNRMIGLFGFVDWRPGRGRVGGAARPGRSRP